MKKRVVLAIISVAILTAVIGGAVYAAFSLTRPAHYNVTPATEAIGLYTDADCTNPIDAVTGVSFGDVEQGQSSATLTVYCKSLSLVDTNVAITNDLPAGLTLSGDTAFALAAGAVEPVDLVLNAAVDATTGAGDFNVTATATRVA